MRREVFFDELAEAWSRAADDVVTLSYDLAGTGLELRFAGEALVPPLTRAFAHLPPATEAGLTVRLWDTESTGVEPPVAPWGADDFREHGTIRGMFDDQFQAVFHWGSHSLTVLDIERGEAVFWVRNAEQMQSFEMAAPLRVVLHGWLQAHGIELVHAAAVGDGDACVLLGGKSGAGKSWTTLAAAAGGLRILADDYCLAVPPRISSVYSAAKTHADALEHLPQLAPMVSNPERGEDDKAVYFLHEHMPDRLLLGAELRAILIPRRTGRTALSPASPASALAALAPTTIIQLPAAGAATLERLTQLVQSAPCYFLDLGDDLDAIAPTIASVL